MESLPDARTGTLIQPGQRTTPLSIQACLPAAAFYFFFNSVGLPHGLFYTTLLSPAIFVWLYLRGQRWLTSKFLLYLSPFILAHLFLGFSSILFYVRSLFLLWTVYVTTYAFCWALLRCRDIHRLFDELITVNFVVSLLALALLYTPARNIVWLDDSDSVASASHLHRLLLLVSEPSVYAGLMLPFLIFAILRALCKSGKRNLIYLCMIGLPFLLCQSFGGISMCLAGIGVCLLSSYRRLFRKPRTLFFSFGLALAVGALFLTHNPISERLLQVVTGGDSSSKSRTIFSFLVAYEVASAKSLMWGVGLGQAKLVDVSDLGLGFTVGIIPNAVAGTFAELGIVGVLVRFTLEIYLFFRTKVYSNSFRLAMFVVTFISQLTGSHLMDVQQYLCWCFAFFPFFPDINLKEGSRKQSA
jgi:hypothetical protein